MVDKRFFDTHGPISLGELIAEISCSVSDEYNETTAIHGASSLAESRSGDVSFIDNRRHLGSLDTAKASA